jgi:hypothetical protein
MRHRVLATLATIAFAGGLAAGCGGEKTAPPLPTEELGLGAQSADKADYIGNRYYDTFGGTLRPGGEPQVAEIQDYGYIVAYTLRAKAGQEFKVSARGVDDPNFDTVIALFGPKSSRGRYNFIRLNDDTGGNLSSVITYTPRRDGIYLLLVTAYGPGRAEVGMSCRGTAEQCDVPCAVVRLYFPVCGEDGRTYGNPQEAACYDVPIRHEGECVIENPLGCESVLCEAPTCDNVECQEGTHCELVEVQCVRAPCYPVPECVPDVNACAVVRCASGTHCEVGPDGNASCVPDTNPCAAVLCGPGTTCEAQPDGSARCVPLAPCRKTGCSSHVCSDQDVITTCEFRPEYACYQQATCERQPDGQCGFTPTPELAACLGGQ